MKQKRLIIGITGGIASGKSTVLELLRKRGYPVISSDTLAHEALEPGTPTYKRISKHYGKDILSSTGNIDRSKLGKIVFSKSIERKWLESVVHPYVVRKLKKFSTKHHGVVFLDIPLLFEAKLSKLVDKILLIATSPETQLKRLMSKRNMSRLDARCRIQSQWPISQKIKKSDWVIWNNDSKTTLLARLLQFEKKLLTLRARGV